MDKLKESRMQVLANQSDLTEAEQDELTALVKESEKEVAQKAAKAALEQANAQKEQEAKEERDAAIKAAVQAERERLEAEQRRLPNGEVAPYQAKYSDTYKYDNLSGSELSLAIEIGKNLGVDFSGGAMKALSLRVAELGDGKNEDERKGNAYVKGAFKAKTKTNIEPTKEAIENSIKAATDPMYTGGSGVGADWVATLFSSEIWSVIRSENRVVANVPSVVIPDGYASLTIPLESTDMSWYKVAEATTSDGTLKVPAPTIPVSQMATGSKNITVGKFGSFGIYTGELSEDSIIAFAPQFREQMIRSGSEIMESAFIDGDVETSASKNINAIDTTPAATDYFLNFDGFRKLALVTNTANSRSAAGSLTIEDFLATMQLMGTAGLAGADPSKVNFIVDGNTYYALSRLPEVKTKDVNNAATVENGFVSKVWGVGVLPSWQMHRASAKRMANNAGKIDADTDSSNTLGAILCVRWDQWKQAYKRRMTIEVTRVPKSDSYEIVALARIGLAYRDSEAAAISYNVGV